MTTPGRTLRLSPEDRRCDREGRRCLCGPRSAELRQADQCRAQRRDCRRSSIAGVSLPAPSARCMRTVAGEYLPGHTSMIRRDPDRHRRLDRAVELSADDDGLEAGAGDCRRQYRRLQAIRTDAADGTEDGAAARRYPAGRRRQRHPRPRRDGRQRADQPSEDRHGLDHRRYRHRQEGAAGRRQDGQAHPSRTRRQGARSSSTTTPISKRSSAASAPSAITMPARTAPPPAASMPQDGIYEKLVADLTSAVSTIKYNLADDTENEIGPLISKRQRDRVASFVERATEQKHIEITTGGKARQQGRLLLPADCRCRRHPGRRDRPPRSLRPRRLRHPLHR